jgi:hypothetical protein
VALCYLARLLDEFEPRHALLHHVAGFAAWQAIRNDVAYFIIPAVDAALLFGFAAIDARLANDEHEVLDRESECTFEANRVYFIPSACAGRCTDNASVAMCFVLAHAGSAAVHARDFVVFAFHPTSIAYRYRICQA